MQVELKDILTWGGTLVVVAGAWFSLKGRVALLEAMQGRDRDEMRKGFNDIKEGLQRIEDKMDGKADK
ncbi:hypothetical protein [Leisingera sp. MMG026]|uniref:hypothetical protein n=1 Tax=Leisingera sp. MMG026 TaxID=2909982 RepID=UPI001F38BBBB|nr:hypothetical protein [Leisingera sp. MMG026]MCF6432648.1 hypothetical protein [Leisingera sp. MMG026]